MKNNSKIDDGVTNISKITVYSADPSLRRPVNMIVHMFRDLISGRPLAWRLAVRDISAQYRQAILGLLWAFILPLAHTITWLFLSGSGIVTVGDTTMPYAIYVFSGTMIWAIFMDAVNAPLQKTLAAKPMLAKINFPRESLILSGIYQTIFNGLIKIVLLIIALALLGIIPGWELFLFPLGIMSIILVGTTLGLLITPIGMLYTDIGKSLPLLMQFLMYLTPVVFPMPTSGLAATFFKYNPMTPLVMTTRNWLTGYPSESMNYYLLVNAAAVALLLAVWIVYRVAMPILIERMSA
jgi:lipopolysaccharide transport system permease protein